MAPFTIHYSTLNYSTSHYSTSNGNNLNDTLKQLIEKWYR